MSKLVRVCALVVLISALTSQPAGAAQYELPVSGQVTDAFRPPATPYGPGNRGWEFATTAGEPVVAVADGVVTFAGQVGGTLNVVVKHADAMLTTYSKLDGVLVVVGQRVAQGDVIATAGEQTYFGVRVDDAYVDPARLFGGRPYLVDGPESPGAPATPAAGPDPGAVSKEQLAWLSQSVPSYWPQLRSWLLQLRP